MRYWKGLEVPVRMLRTQREIEHIFMRSHMGRTQFKKPKGWRRGGQAEASL